MWLIFAALTVLFWGTSETIFKKSSKGDEYSVPRLLAYNGVFFGLSGIIYMLFVYKGFNFDFLNVIRYLPIASIFILSMWSYYHAMSAAKISIISPIVNTSCLVTVLLSIFILKEHPSAVNLVAIILIIFSLAMLSINKTPEDDIEKDLLYNRRCEADDNVVQRSNPASLPRYKVTGLLRRCAPRNDVALPIYIISLLFAFGYFILDGIASFLVGFTLEERMTEQDMVISHSFISFAVGIGCYIYLKIKDKNYKFKLDKPKLIGSVLETAGEYTYIYAMGAGLVSIVSPFVASYSVVTIILSKIFLKEKLKKKQYAWIICILLGIIFLSI